MVTGKINEFGKELPTTLPGKFTYILWQFYTFIGGHVK